MEDRYSPKSWMPMWKKWRECFVKKYFFHEDHPGQVSNLRLVIFCDPQGFLWAQDTYKEWKKERHLLDVVVTVDKLF